MDIILFFLTSTIECLAIHFLMLTLFRFKLKEYALYSLFISLAMTLLSYSIRHHPSINAYAIYPQIFTMIIGVRLLLKIQWFYASLMTTIAYCSYLSIQVLMYFLLFSANLLNFNTILKNSEFGIQIMGYILQTLTLIATILIIVAIKKSKAGWQYIPLGKVKVRYSRTVNILLLVGMAVAITGFGSVIIIGVSGNEIEFFTAFIVLVFILMALIKLSNKKDEVQYD